VDEAWRYRGGEEGGAAAGNCGRETDSGQLDKKKPASFAGITDRADNCSAAITIQRIRFIKDSISNPDCQPRSLIFALFAVALDLVTTRHRHSVLTRARNALSRRFRHSAFLPGTHPDLHSQNLPLMPYLPQ
jgi:hypothetical protein